jgi:tubulin monoglycylase TTLL3/8
VQKYIHNPLLIHKRKFDIRTYTMVTSMGGNIKGYVYDEGYIRTSSYEFDINNFDRLIHLTNDAVQKRDKNYGKHEPGNKMSYSEFQIYIDKYHGELNVCFERDMVPQIQKMATDVFRAVYGKIDPKRRVNTFEVFGLDFMIDDEFKPYLIEVNTNPCLELSSPLLARLIPNMLENAFKIAVDPLFPPPEGFSTKKAFLGDPCPENKFTLVFDHKVDGPVIDNLMKNKNSVISKSNLYLFLTFIQLKWTRKTSVMRRSIQTMLTTMLAFDFKL